MNRTLLSALLVLILAGVFWVTWNSLESGSQSIWSYTQLVQQADAHHVASASIQGTSAKVFDDQGRLFHVTVPSNDTALVHQLVADGVDVKLEPQPGLADLIVPNLVLLILLGGVVAGIVVVARAVAARRA